MDKSVMYDTHMDEKDVDETDSYSMSASEQEQYDKLNDELVRGAQEILDATGDTLTVISKQCNHERLSNLWKLHNLTAILNYNDLRDNLTDSVFILTRPSNFPKAGVDTESSLREDIEEIRGRGKYNEHVLFHLTRCGCMSRKDGQGIGTVWSKTVSREKFTGMIARKRRDLESKGKSPGNSGGSTFFGLLSGKKKTNPITSSSIFSSFDPPHVNLKRKDEEKGTLSTQAEPGEWTLTRHLARRISTLSEALNDRSQRMINFLNTHPDGKDEFGAPIANSGASTQPKGSIGSYSKGSFSWALQEFESWENRGKAKRHINWWDWQVTEV